MHYATFGAWCRRNGDHVTKRQKHLDWNFDLLEPVVRDAPSIWKPFEENVELTKERCRIALHAMLDDVRNNLQGK